MHETALVRNLLATVGQAIDVHHIKKVNRVVISAGKLANVLPDALTFAFEAMTQDGLQWRAVTTADMNIRRTGFRSSARYAKATVLGS